MKCTCGKWVTGKYCSNFCRYFSKDASVAALRAAGQTIENISALTGLSVSGVRYSLARSGAGPTGRPAGSGPCEVCGKPAWKRYCSHACHSRARRSPAREEIKKLSHLPAAQVARDLGCNLGLVYRVFKELRA